MTLTLHGFVHAEPAPDHRHVVWNDLAAVVSDGKPTEAMPHFEILCALVAARPVVPVVFGTVADSEDAIRTEVLPSVAAEVRAQLTRLADVVEFHVYLRFQGNSVLTADRVLEPVAMLADDSAVLPGEQTQARRAYLVPRSRMADVARTATGLAAGDIHVDVIGPLPAFSFLDRKPAASRWGW
jgi:hypothetical protein